MYNRIVQLEENFKDQVQLPEHLWASQKLQHIHGDTVQTPLEC